MFNALPLHVSNQPVSKLPPQLGAKGPLLPTLGKTTDSMHSIDAEKTSPLLSRKSAARYLGLSPQTLAQWACNKKVLLPYLKIGRRVMYRRADLDAFIAANVQGLSPHQFVASPN